MKTHLLVGTRKGLFALSSDNRHKWTLKGPFLAGKEVNHAILDRRNGRLLATSNDGWFGSELMWSDDKGESWNSSKGINFRPEGGINLERIWHIEPDLSSAATIYAGVAPAALFRSDDGGVSWSEIESLSRHATRPQWTPGAGGMCLHSIVIDPTTSNRFWVGISAAGVFRTEDAGETWTPLNQGVRAESLPNKYPEVGQCVHKLLGNEDVLYQQNHCGVYRSENGGDNWTEITANLPSDFGFPLALHPRERSLLFVIPLEGAEFRCPSGGNLVVFRSSDGGRSWQPKKNGLPCPSYSKVLREAMTTDTADPAGVYFGTDSGKIFGSIDAGDEWYEIADELPPVYSVEAYSD